jgi:hypothetical protein
MELEMRPHFFSFLIGERENMDKHMSEGGREGKEV